MTGTENLSLSAHIQSEEVRLLSIITCRVNFDRSKIILPAIKQKFQTWLTAKKVDWQLQISRKRRRTEPVVQDCQQLPQSAFMRRTEHVVQDYQQAFGPSMPNSNNSKKDPIDYRTVGVRQMPSGNYVRILHTMILCLIHHVRSKITIYQTIPHC